MRSLVDALLIIYSIRIIYSSLRGIYMLFSKQYKSIKLENKTYLESIVAVLVIVLSLILFTELISIENLGVSYLIIAIMCSKFSLLFLNMKLFISIKTKVIYGSSLLLPNEQLIFYKEGTNYIVSKKTQFYTLSRKLKFKNIEEEKKFMEIREG